MNAKDYKQLKREAEDRFKKTVEMAEKRRREELEAIETVYRISHPKRRSIQTSGINIVQQSKVHSTKYGSLAGAIVDSLKLVPYTFNKTDIRGALKEVSPEIEKDAKESSITGRLIRLVKQGIIEQVSTGKGSTPSQYRKIPEKEQQGEEDLFEDKT